MPTTPPALGTVVIKQGKPVSRPPPMSTRRELSVTNTAASGAGPGPKGRSKVNLTNDIHPVFAERLLINGIQPAVVADVMRAASRFLLSPASLSFMHTIFFSQAEPIANVLHGEEDMQSFEFSDAPIELTLQQARKTLKALEKLADDLVIGLCDSALEETGKTAFPWLGGGAFIMISRKGYEELIAAQRDGRQDDVAWLTFRIAMTLLHELGHAACFVRNGLGHYYFTSSPVAEEGYELVQRVFGGTMYLMPQGKPSGGMGCNTPATKIMLLQWPSPLVVEQYVKCGVVGVRGDLGTQRPMQAVVPFAFVQRVLQDSFYGSDGRLQGLKALHPKCSEQMRYTPFKRSFRLVVRNYLRAKMARKAPGS